MAFLRYARAQVTRPQVQGQLWDNVRVASGVRRADRNLVDQASKILQDDFDPSKYLLTHATIVASVDTVPGPSTKLGKVTEEGRKIVRKTANYRVKASCDKFINNNLDCWARPVLLKSYPTFVGAHSFVEHVQIENLSKGRIIDAVGRDIGDSIYVDILVANDRKHAELIKDIESGKLSTLSMGCSIDGSTCTKCGHWAADETEFCDHIKYEKGNIFYDDNGQKYRVAELCGDESLDPSGGVKFIEASWVEIPAFTGAVARNIITVNSESGKKKTAQQIQRVFEGSEPFSPDLGSMQRAASDLGLDRQADLSYVAGMFDEEEGGETPPPSEPVKSPLDDLRGKVKQHLLDDVLQELEDEMSKKDVEDQVIPKSDAPNDSVVKQAKHRFVRAGMKRVYVASLRTLVSTASNDAALMNGIATLNAEIGIQVPVSVYRAALKVGAYSRYAGPQQFLKAAGEALGHTPSHSETRTLARLAYLLEERSNHSASRRNRS